MHLNTQCYAEGGGGGGGEGVDPSRLIGDFMLRPCGNKPSIHAFILGASYKMLPELQLKAAVKVICLKVQIDVRHELARIQANAAPSKM